jgi:hypothetical protein
VISPYFVPGEDGVALMRELTARRAHPRTDQLAGVHRFAAGAQRLCALPRRRCSRWASNSTSAAQARAETAEIPSVQELQREPARQGAGHRSENRVHRITEHGRPLGAHQQRTRAGDAQQRDRPPGHELLDDISEDGSYKLQLDHSDHIEWVERSARCGANVVPIRKRRSCSASCLKLLTPFAPEELL